jgi:hypothetical protein
MARRKDNPARKAVTTPPVTVQITPEDIASARERFRKHAPRKYWGLVDATPAEPTAPNPPPPKTTP